MTALPPEVTERLHRLAADGPGGAGTGRRLIGVAGAPGSGKSTLAAAVVQEVGDAVVAVPMDGFHLAQAELERLGRAHRKGAPDTFDAAGFVALLRRLRYPTPEPVYAPAFDRHLEEPIAGAIRVDPDVPLILVEGNYLLLDDGVWGQVAWLLDECWYVEVDDAVRVERLVARHVAHGRSPEEAREWVLRSDEANAAVIATTRWRADLVIPMA